MQYPKVLFIVFKEKLCEYVTLNLLYNYVFAVIFPIMLVLPPLETLITITQGLFVCNILKLCLVVFEKKIFEDLISRNQIFVFFYIQSCAKMPVGGISI